MTNPLQTNKSLLLLTCIHKASTENACLSKSASWWSLMRRCWRHSPPAPLWWSLDLPLGVCTAWSSSRRCRRGNYHCLSKSQSVKMNIVLILAVLLAVDKKYYFILIVVYTVRVEKSNPTNNIKPWRYPFKQTSLLESECCLRSQRIVTWNGSSAPKGKLVHLSSCPQWLAMNELHTMSDSVKRGLKWKAILSSRSHRKLISNLERKAWSIREEFVS